MIRADNYFAIIPEWVLDADISPQAVRLYCVLARYAGRDGTCYPRRRTIAERLRVSVSTVDRVLAELVNLGAVEVRHRLDDNGEHTSNLYTIKTTPPTLIDPWADVLTHEQGGRMDAATSPHGWGEGGRVDDDQRRAISNESQRSSPALAQDTAESLADMYEQTFSTAHGAQPAQQSVKRIAQAAKQLLAQGHPSEVIRQAVEDCAMSGNSNLPSAVTFALARRGQNDDMGRNRKIDDCLDEARTRWPNGPEHLISTWATAMRDKRAGRGPGPSVALYQLLDDTNPEDVSHETDA